MLEALQLKPASGLQSRLGGWQAGNWQCQLMCAEPFDPKRRCTDLVGLLAEYVEHQLPPDVHDELERHLARAPAASHSSRHTNPPSRCSTPSATKISRQSSGAPEAFIDRNCKN